MVDCDAVLCIPLTVLEPLLPLPQHISLCHVVHFARSRGALRWLGVRATAAVSFLVLMWTSSSFPCCSQFEACVRRWHVCRLKAALRRLDVRDADDFDEEEYRAASEAVRQQTHAIVQVGLTNQ